MKFKSALVTQVSGSVGGLTGSHNQGGMYFRARSIPKNPNSPLQMEVRANLAAAAGRWSNVLDEVQREAWRTYADNVPLVDALGESRKRSGIAHYIRSQTPRVQAGLIADDDAPTVMTLAQLTSLAPAITDGTANLVLGFTETDEWVEAAGAGLLVYASTLQQGAINFFKGPYRYLGMIPGNVATPPVSPQTLTLPFTVPADGKVFVRCEASMPDGRLSLPFCVGVLAD